MSKWHSPEWDRLLSGEICPICRQGEPHGIIARLDTTYLTSDVMGAMYGNCTLFLKRHAVDVHDLEADEACAFMIDLQKASASIQEVTGAIKMNYEIHGNTIPHLHVHLFPRYKGDPFEGGPINPRAVAESPYKEGEFEIFVQNVRSLLSQSS